jgi:subtilisin family serine protease
MARLAALGALVVTILALGAEARTLPPASSVDPASTEVIVTLASPPLARAPGTGERIAHEQRAFRRALERELPLARMRWRYRLVANGFSVVLPKAQVPRLHRLAGVRDVFASAQYGVQLDDTPEQIGAPALWGAGLSTAGQGMKIGIIDTGVDASHPFFDPTGYTMPSGFPKGQVRFTSAKVIVARAFPPRGVTSQAARAAVDPEQSDHGTHVAGIAAGNDRTRASGGRIVSGVAPRAYLGNYKALTRTEFGLSPNGNAPEIVAAIEAAVADGMDVLNLSLGEPEIEPSRDVVALALDAAAAAGVVPVVAAGNDYNDFGAGSVSSPASSQRAITVAAVETEGTPPSSVHAEFSSVGPTTISLRLKPDVAAPGVDVLSSVPGAGWTSSSGTSMAAPHVAGAAALLAQRHPTWTVEQIKSALVQTGTNARRQAGGSLAGPTFVGGGVISLPAADRPLLFAEPSSLSWGLLGRSSTVEGGISLANAGGGAGTWQASLERLTAPAGTTVTVPSAVDVPGELAYQVATSPTAAQGELSGYIRLRREGVTRRIAFWARVAVPALARHRVLELSRVGMHTGTTEGRPALVTRYRYPEDPSGLDVTTVLRGPEAVYRVVIDRRVANLGVVITRRARGSFVEPRIVTALDENRIAGYAGLPVTMNPYVAGPFGFRSPAPVAAVLSPLPGEYFVVFDSATREGAGAFRFRFWVNDVVPPAGRVLSKQVRRGQRVQIAVADSGSGVEPSSIFASFDGRPAPSKFESGIVRVATGALAPGKHRLRLTVHDWQETKNTENVARILPNARIVAATITIRP